MRLLITFAQAYPWQSSLTLLGLLLAGVMEGIGLTALLPLLSVASNAQVEGGTAAVMASGSGPGAMVTDVLAAVGLSPTIDVLLIVIVTGITFKGVLLLLANRQVGYTVAHVATDLRLALMHALLSTRWEYYLRQSVGSLANAVATEAMRASNAYLNGVTVIALLIQALVYAGVALFISWKVTLVALAAGSVLLFLLNRLVRTSRKAGRRQTQLLKSLLARLTDSLQSVKPLKAMARENLADNLLEKDTQRLNRALRRQVFSREALTAAQEPMMAALIAVGIYVALVVRGMALGAVLVMVFLLARVLAHLGRVQRQYQKMVIAESAYWSLQSAIDEARGEQEAVTGDTPPPGRPTIRLVGAGFAYGDEWVLRDASLTLVPGALTVLVGASGAGKTTVIDLLTGLLRPQEGEVWLDELPMSQVDIRQWREQIGYVPQEIVLLHDTVQHNVTLGDPALEAGDAERALRAAGAWEFISRMPEGMQTTVGERGSRLSGGQRQRIAIARALAHQPGLLILDEATSALDTASAAAICRTLESLKGELTIFAITHQANLAELAERVYRLEAGSCRMLEDYHGQTAVRLSVES